MLSGSFCGWLKESGWSTRHSQFTPGWVLEVLLSLSKGLHFHTEPYLVILVLFTSDPNPQGAKCQAPQTTLALLAQLQVSDCHSLSFLHSIAFVLFFFCWIKCQQIIPVLLHNLIVGLESDSTSFFSRQLSILVIFACKFPLDWELERTGNEFRNIIF